MCVARHAAAPSAPHLRSGPPATGRRTCSSRLAAGTARSPAAPGPAAAEPARGWLGSAAAALMPIIQAEKAWQAQLSCPCPPAAATARLHAPAARAWARQGWAPGTASPRARLHRQTINCRSDGGKDGPAAGPVAAAAKPPCANATASKSQVFGLTLRYFQLCNCSCASPGGGPGGAAAGGGPA